LPPVLFPATQGLKYYPDQPVIEDVEVATGLSGTRSDSAALVPTRAGSWELPELRIPWWDTQAKQMRVATLPARTINVNATPGASGFDNPIDNPTAITSSATGDDITIVRQNNTLWQIIAAISAIGWLLTLAYLVLSRRSTRPNEPAQPGHSVDEKLAYKKLMAACSTNSATHIRPTLIAWARAFLDGQAIATLEQARDHFADDEFDHELRALDAALYGELDEQWSGQTLANAVNRLRKRGENHRSGDSETLALYPAN
jgi:hypothetical protein